MALPLALGLGLMAGSTALNMHSSYQQGKQARQAARYNAILSEEDAAAYARNAELSDVHRDRSVESIGRDYAAAEGDTMAALVANGMDVNSASAVSYLLQGANSARQDAALVREDASRTWNEQINLSRGALRQADMYRIQGNNAYRSGILGAGSSLVGGLANMYMMGSKVPATSPDGGGMTSATWKPTKSNPNGLQQFRTPRMGG